MIIQRIDIVREIFVCALKSTHFRMRVALLILKRDRLFWTIWFKRNQEMFICKHALTRARNVANNLTIFKNVSLKKQTFDQLASILERDCAAA